MKKVHLLLVENSENQIEFFTDALEESGLSFFCNTAKSVEQAFKILKNSIPDIIFIDNRMVQGRNVSLLRKIQAAQKTPVVVYSTVLSKKLQANYQTSNYVQLPNSVYTMAKMFKNLFIDNEVRN